MVINIEKRLKSPLAQLLKSRPMAISVLKLNELVEAKFITRDKQVAYFDLGKKGTGIIYGLELLNAQDTVKTLNPGDQILVKVVDPENERGYAELSLRETYKQKAWEEIRELEEQDTTLPVKITAANSGGLIAQINNLQAFLPVSQLAGNHYPQVGEGERAKILEELKKLVGETINIKIIDVNARTNKLIISEKATANENIKEKLAKYQVGEIVDGIITSVADFGAFVKFANDPEIEGLIHISELDHRLIENPKEVVKIDDAVKAKIIEIKEGRVSLSLKALKENPWDKVAGKYQVGQVVGGIVSRFNPFGAFISLDPDIQGLIHVSEFGSVKEMKNQMELGKEYNFLIELVRPEEKRIFLKLKRE